MTLSNVLILIPARYASSRFEGKPLALIHGRSMIDHVASIAQKTDSDYAVVTDDPRIESEVKRCQHPVCRVDDETQSGSERLFLAYHRFFERTKKSYDWIINLQGDEPLMKPEVLKNFIHTLSQCRFDMMTMVRERKNDFDDFQNPHIVKAVVSSHDGQCLYFSRSPVPYQSNRWYQHIGLYAYRVTKLSDFERPFDSLLEKSEKLEQLQFLEKSLSIGSFVYKGGVLIGVDTPGDIHKVENLL